jgi:hypothetical protein
VTVYLDETDPPAAYTGSNILQDVFDFGDVSFERVSSTFKNVSDSIICYIREDENANHSAPTLGLVLQDQTCIQVQWSWLAFSAMLVALITVFLAAQDRRRIAVLGEIYS